MTSIFTLAYVSTDKRLRAHAHTVLCCSLDDDGADDAPLTAQLLLERALCTALTMMKPIFLSLLAMLFFFSIDRLTINAVRGQFFTRLWILANPFCNAADFLCRVTMAFNESDILRSAALHLALLARYFAFDWTFFFM